MILNPMTVTVRHETHIPIDPWSAVVYVACAVAVALLTRRRPGLGVAALLVLAPFDFAHYVGPTTITMLKAGLVGMLTVLVFSKTPLAPLWTRPVRAALFGFAFVLVAIALSAIHAEFYAPVVREIFKNAEYAALFVSAVLAFASDPDDRPFWFALELVVMLVALSALSDYIFGGKSGIYIGGHLGGAYFPRIAGALEGPNQLAGYLDITIPVLVARALVHRDRLLQITLVFAATVDVLTISRSGMFGVVIGTAVVMLVLRSNRRVLGRFTVVVTTVVILGFIIAMRAGVPSGYFSLSQQIQPEDHLSNRGKLYAAAVELFHRSPWVGVGAGNYELELASVGLTGVRTHSNNLYLQSLAETGVVGLAATLTQIFVMLVTFGYTAVRRPLVVGALGSTVALAMHQIGDYVVFYPKVGSAYWIISGIATAEVATQLIQRRRRQLQQQCVPGSARSER